MRSKRHRDTFLRFFFVDAGPVWMTVYVPVPISPEVH
jgi:hypothetical protein